jgi:hypothetical protein
MPTPNTTFVSGAVLTAAQQNNFPRGVMALNSATATDATITAEEVQITGSSFTAVAGRNYKITYFEPNPTGGTGYFAFRIRQTNLAGTVLNTAYQTAGASIERQSHLIWVGTFSAGTVNVVATAQQTAGTGSLVRASTVVAYLLVEDIGPT